MIAGQWKSVLVVLAAVVVLASCRANAPSAAEARLVAQLKKQSIGGKDSKNPVPDTPESQKTGAEHFQHHCQICHGLDGHNTGVPFAAQMSPPVADLGDKSVQAYTDGQLRWIIDNGIRFTGMPSWHGILDDNEQWTVINFLRHLPAKGSLGPPDIYKEAEEEHKELEQQGRPGSAPPHEHKHGDKEHQHEHKH